MTKEEIFNKFPYIFKYGTYGHSCECTICTYFDICNKMQLGFIKPKECSGPFFYKNKD